MGTILGFFFGGWGVELVALLRTYFVLLLLTCAIKYVTKRV